MWDDDMTPEDALVEPIRAKIASIAYVLWNRQDDLPREVEDEIAEVMQDIKELVGRL